METCFDILIIGAGPIGIACGVEAKQHGLTHLILEKGCLANAVYNFPTQLTFFSTADLLELGNVPFLISGSKPTRHEILNYYKRIAQHFKLNVHLFEQVKSIQQADGCFQVQTDRQEYHANTVALAIGFYDHPKMLNVPGEELPNVTHYYREAHQYFDQRVAIIGGGNSGVEAALEIFRAGAKKVTFIHRQRDLNRSIKYWILPDFRNRVKEGSIEAHFGSRVREIREKSILIEKDDGELLEIDNDFVLAMTGYHPDFEFLTRAGVALCGEQKKPQHDPDTMETNIPGLYIAGVATGGMNTNKIFIENGRIHARRIVQNILKKTGKQIDG